MMMMAIKQSPKVLTEHEKKIITNIFQSCGFEMNALTDILESVWTIVSQIILMIWSVKSSKTIKENGFFLHGLRQQTQGSTIFWIQCGKADARFWNLVNMLTPTNWGYTLNRKPYPGWKCFRLQGNSKNPENLKYEYDEKTVETGVFVINIHGHLETLRKSGKSLLGVRCSWKMQTERIYRKL